MNPILENPILESPVLEVLAPGLQTTVQDGGRAGWRHLGVARAGAMDPALTGAANRLVGNDPAAAVLELTLQGPRLQLLAPVRLALTGASVQARFEGTSIPGGRPVELPPGRLDLGPLREGARAWLALAGGIDVPRVLGSRSTDLRGGFGGLRGRALKRGDTLALLDPPQLACEGPRIAPWWIDPLEHDGWRGHPPPIRYRPSGHPCADALARGEWRINASSNRQGLRLEGAPLSGEAASGVSEPVAPGTIQLPADGQPIVLLADAQTVGGYPRLGHVIAADLPRLAQCRPGEPLRLVACDAETANRAACEARARLARMALMIDHARQHWPLA